MTATNLEYLTKCRVPGCTKQFVSSPLDIPIVGQPDAQVMKFIAALMDHMQKKHPSVMAQIAQHVQEFMGFLVVSLFEMEDPKLLGMRERVRSDVAKVSRRFQISDAEILDRVARLELDPDEEEGLTMLLKDMRDVLTEQGKYTPEHLKNKQPSLIPPV